MVVKKLAAAGIVALTVASAASVTAFASEKAAKAVTYYTPTITTAVGNGGVTPQVVKEYSGNGDVGVLSGIPEGEAVWLYILDEDGYAAADSVYYNSYAMDHEFMYGVAYSKGKGIVGKKYSLKSIYQRQYTYNPESFKMTVKWHP